jgi:hypothetical protein
MCTMNAIANSGVARLTIGIDTKAAMNMPATKTVLEIFAPEQKCGGEEKDHGADTGEQQERHRDEIDQDRERGRLGAFDGGAAKRQGSADRLAGVVRALHLERDIVDEEAPDQRGHRRHQEHRSDDDAEAGGDGQNPCKDRYGRVRADAQQAFGPIRAGGGDPDQQSVERDAEEYDQDQRQPCALQECRPEWRREHL